MAATARRSLASPGTGYFSSARSEARWNHAGGRKAAMAKVRSCVAYASEERLFSDMSYRVSWS